jgi:hypothetical protein
VAPGIVLARCLDARWLAFARFALAFALAAVALGPASVAADTIPLKHAEIAVDEDAYVLNAEFELSINATLEEALQRGVPLYFVLDFELVRPRWWWVDEKVVSLATQYRVSFNPLTRQYRVSSGLLGQTLDTLQEVERLLSRVNGRPIARVDELVKGAKYEAAIRLRLDVNQLPKPFQVNALASRDWSLTSDWQRWSFVP